MDATLFPTGSTEWETPQDFFDFLNRIFKFDIDACATKHNAKCKRYFTPEINSLTQDWTGTVWCNPPYDRSIEKWLNKAQQSHEKGAVVVMLLPAKTDTKWIHKHVFGKTQVIFLKGRLKFGNSDNSAPFPSMLAVWGGPRIRCGFLEGNLEGFAIGKDNGASNSSPDEDD